MTSKETVKANGVEATVPAATTEVAPIGTGNVYAKVEFSVDGVLMVATITRSNLEYNEEYETAALFGAMAETAREEGDVAFLGDVSDVSVVLAVGGKERKAEIVSKSGRTFNLEAAREQSIARRNERRSNANTPAVTPSRVGA